MTPQIDGGASAGSSSEPRDRRDRRWLLACALALVAAVLVLAARTEQAAPVESSERIGRSLELRELIVAEQERAQSLAQQVDELSAEVSEYEATAARGSDEVSFVQDLLDEISAPAGLTKVRGPGLTVTLEDSSLELDEATDPNNLVIHEEDLQALMNALWAAGAEAMSINGERLVATSEVRCYGTTVLVNGSYHSIPFVIDAIGDPGALEDQLEEDPLVEGFTAAAEEYELGFDVETKDTLEVAAHTDPSSLEVAQPTARTR